MIKLAVVGLGKMGLSHHAMINAHPAVEVSAICDSSGYVLSVLKKYTGVATYSDYEAMLDAIELDAVIIATPSSSHAGMVQMALEKGIHVFCEKPFTLSSADSRRLADLAREKQRVTQVGYHNRFVGAFGEAKSLLEAGAIGDVTHALAEAYGPVVLKPKGGTWRSQRNAGGGCLYDYAAHVIDLASWYMGEPSGVGGTSVKSIFSRETDDGVFSTLYFPSGPTVQLSVDWSDESFRKMTTRMTIWGTAGRIFVDRQECQAYLRGTVQIPPGYETGWNVRYTTELTKPVWFYLRGEEYSAQLDAFVARIEESRISGINDFQSATITDRVIELLVADAHKGASTTPERDAASIGLSDGKPARRRWSLRGIRTQRAT